MLRDVIVHLDVLTSDPPDAGLGVAQIYNYKFGATAEVRGKLNGSVYTIFPPPAGTSHDPLTLDANDLGAHTLVNQKLLGVAASSSQRGHMTDDQVQELEALVIAFVEHIDVLMVAAHPASAISVADVAENFTGTDVEAVLAELVGMGGGGGTLDQAYDFGGAGAGRVINVDAALPVKLIVPAGGDYGLDIWQGAEGFPRWQVNGRGEVFWGSGSGNPDTVLYRSAANTLCTDDTFSVDVIGERSSNQGVIIDGVRLKDNFVELDEIAAPGTPASAKVRVYAKSDGRAYSKDDGGVERALGGKITHIFVFTPKGESLVDEEDWSPLQAFKLPPSGEHGTYAALRVRCRARVAGTGTNTVKLQTSTTIAGSRTDRATIALNTATEPSDITSFSGWVPANDEYIWVRATDVGATAPKDVQLELYISEELW